MTGFLVFARNSVEFRLAGQADKALLRNDNSLAARAPCNERNVGNGRLSVLHIVFIQQFFNRCLQGTGKSLLVAGFAEIGGDGRTNPDRYLPTFRE